MNHAHVHVGQGLPIDFFGGTYTVIRNLALAQSRIPNHEIFLVTDIGFFSNKIYKVDQDGRIVAAEKIPFKGGTIFHFHFSYTMLKFIIGNPRVLRNTRIFHFHGPWFKESQFQGDKSLKVRAKRLIERISFKFVNVFICASEAFRGILLTEYGKIERNSEVLPLGVNFDEFSLTRSHYRDFPSFNNDFPVIGSIRRLVPRMGIEILLNAVAVNGRVNLVIAGDGSLRISLETLAIKLGIADRVRFVGRISEEEKCEFYKLIRLLVVPSVALEGFGLVVLEAMACGTPVLSSNIDGLTEAMGPFVLTNTYASNHPMNLSEKINSILSDDFLMNGEQYVAYAKTRTWSHLANAIESILCA